MTELAIIYVPIIAMICEYWNRNTMIQMNDFTGAEEQKKRINKIWATIITLYVMAHIFHDDLFQSWIGL